MKIKPDFSEWTWGGDNTLEPVIQPLAAQIASVLFEQIRHDWKQLDLSENGLEVAFCYDERKEWVVLPLSEMQLPDVYLDYGPARIGLNNAIAMCEQWIVLLRRKQSDLNEREKRERERAEREEAERKREAQPGPRGRPSGGLDLRHDNGSD